LPAGEGTVPACHDPRMNRPLVRRLLLVTVAAVLVWLTTGVLWAALVAAGAIVALVYGLGVWYARRRDLSPGARGGITSLAVLFVLAVIIDLVFASLL
jgi:hypothetical protein